MSGSIMDYPPEDWLDHYSGQVIDSSKLRAKRRCVHGYLQAHAIFVDRNYEGRCDPVALESRPPTEDPS